MLPLETLFMVESRVADIDGRMVRTEAMVKQGVLRAKAILLSALRRSARIPHSEYICLHKLYADPTFSQMMRAFISAYAQADITAFVHMGFRIK